MNVSSNKCWCVGSRSKHSWHRENSFHWGKITLEGVAFLLGVGDGEDGDDDDDVDCGGDGGDDVDGGDGGDGGTLILLMMTTKFW